MLDERERSDHRNHQEIFIAMFAFIDSDNVFIKKKTKEVIKFLRKKKITPTLFYNVHDEPIISFIYKQFYFWISLDKDRKKIYYGCDITSYSKPFKIKIMEYIRAEVERGNDYRKYIDTCIDIIDQCLQEMEHEKEI